MIIDDNKLSVNILWVSLMSGWIAFLSGLAKSYFDCSFDHPLSVLIPFKVIAKASKTSGILNTLWAQEMLTMNIS